MTKGLDLASRNTDLDRRDIVPDGTQFRAIETPQIFGAHFNKDLRRHFLMTNKKTAAFMIYSALTAIVASEASAAGDGEGEWRMYSQELNGDVYFFDPSRVKRVKNLHSVWSRVRYKTSVMGARSYQSLLEIDCSERTEKVLQNTFFSDKHWKKPAMNTDTTEKPKRLITNGSATERLSKVLCNK